ncbi:hypothetical protein ASF69_15600 [Rhizobium sp. Leaf311]|uniref:ImmA/IrrE family metallo-endopeptidase n=1 Tax=Rhizobium sp. Leaf311 TaxID=1736332 RepID=UPI000713C681|nr:ImmA/IrrE family metallo-endopeptidase [Rhizobium sp. Leaf311]KQQ58762.1 hypothetical protein ASF69_15600 [Rhizobium sp. Leaf311]
MNRHFVYPKPLGVKKASVEVFAPQIAEALQFKPGDDIIALVARLGGKVVSGSTGNEDIESGSMIARSISDFTIYLSPLTSLERDRFTVAHELGHLLLHLPKVIEDNPSAVMRATRHVDNQDATQQRAEWEANWFAASFLMPDQLFRDSYNRGISFMQQKFKVSRAAIEARAKSLKLV